MSILILANSPGGLYNFRAELFSEFLNSGQEVYISVPYANKYELLEHLGFKCIDTPIDRRGINFIKDIALIKKYKKIISDIKPDIILTYTIKPNIYGGILAAALNIPYITNITGLGSVFESNGILNRFVKMLYKFALRKSSCVFFQNTHNEELFKKSKVISSRSVLLPGSGVNLERFNVLEYPPGDTVEFVFIGRIMKEKGINEYLEAAQFITSKYSDVNFHICGDYEEDYKDILAQMQEKGIIKYHGQLNDVREILKTTHCTINPSYHEGMSNVLLESSASTRPCLCSDIPGCREIVDNQNSGYNFTVKSSESLIEAIETFLKLTYEQKKQMGIAAREYVEKKFDRKIVINAYMNELKKLNIIKEEEVYEHFV